MLEKLQYIEELSDKTLKELSKRENWFNYLKTASNHYKYSFRDSYLIYTQRPDATAVASYELWNNTMHRFINRGSKGIALIDRKQGKPILNHVFDISDTNGEKMPFVWQYKDEYAERINAEIVSSFDVNQSVQYLDGTIALVVDSLIEENMSELLSELKYAKDNSFLEDLDDQNLEVIYREVLKESVTATILFRCDYSMDINEYNFSRLHFFSSDETMILLGSTVSEISETILREIELSVKTIERVQRQNIERSNQHGNEVQGSGQNTVSGLSNQGDNSRTFDQIRDDEEGISGEELSGQIQHNDTEGDTISPLQGNGTGSQNADGNEDISDEEADRPELVTNQNIGDRESTNQGNDSSPIDEQDDIDHVILSGSGYEGGKQRIVDYYFQDHTNTEKAAFLKDEYGTGGGTVVFSESRRGYQGHNAKGIEIHNSGFDNSSIHLTWSKVSKRIGELIENEKYFQQRYPSDIPIIKPNIVDNTEIQGAEEAPFLMDENITEPETNTAEKKRKTQPEMNFSRLQKLAPHIMDKRYSYSKLQSDGFMDLSIEWIGENKLAMSHYGKQNGDLMADPDMTMIIDFEKKTLMPATFQNDYVGVYQEVYLENNQWRPKLSKELTSFLSTWLKNIEHQGHVLRFAKYYQEEMQSIPVALNGEGQEYGFDIPHDIISLAQLEPYRKAQNARKAKIPIEDELKYEPSFGELGNGITVWNTLEEVDGDYQTIAHIGEDGTITYYVDDLPKAIIERIEKNATPSIPDKQQEMVEYGYQWEGMINLDDEEAIRLFDAGHDIYLLHDDNTESLCESEKRLIQHINDGGLVGLEKEVASIAINNTRQSEKLNFHITDDSLGAVGIKEKYKNNIAAIRLLKIIEGENRLATSDEQEVLSQYVGWGGLSKVFDETDNSWSNEYAELKGILDDTEYKAARSSVLSAYYTPPIVIKSMYKAIENMGFSDGNILEPAMGIGNFMGLLPLSLSDSNMYGVELDSISGRMAKQLYQRENIQVTGLEHTAFHDNFFDVAIGNVPFGSYGVTDKRYDKHNFMIHDYFMAKALDKVRPGGIVAFITSKGTLDKKNSSVRKYLAQRAELVGAIRLPNNAFKANAGTEVTSDIIFLKKRDSIQDIEPDWVQLGTTWDGLPINQYFADNPHMILGTLKKQIGMYGAEDITCIPFEGSNLENQLAEAITHIHAEIEENEYMIDEPETHDTSIPADPNVKNYSFTIMDDKLYYRENSRMNPVDTNVKAEQRIRGMLGLSKTLHLLIDYQLEGYAEHAIIGMQSKLNEQYDNFVKELGRISERGNSLAFSDDSSYYLLTSLENYDDNGQFKNKADIFTKQTIRPNKIIKKVDTASEALAVSIGRKAKVDIGFMSSLTNKESQQIINDLQGIIFKDPLSDLSSPYEGFLAADEYLSGDVRDMTCPT